MKKLKILLGVLILSVLISGCSKISVNDIKEGVNFISNIVDSSSEKSYDISSIPEFDGELM